MCTPKSAVVIRSLKAASGKPRGQKNATGAVMDALYVTFLYICYSGEAGGVDWDRCASGGLMFLCASGIRRAPRADAKAVTILLTSLWT